ncbi:MAG: MerR family transcriptional regulator [Syntrophorhabdales bacterium]|jgi:DNA-binding transcriptional MerR regulator
MMYYYLRSRERDDRPDREGDTAMKKPFSDNVNKGVRMKELTGATGLPKSTILHYVAQGLLPEPVRTSRNMAFYDPACIERARYVKALQSTYFFPLAKIKTLLSLRDEGKDTNSLIELNTVVFGTSDGAALHEEAFRSATGLTSPQVSELLEAHLLMPLEKGAFRQDDIDAGRVYAGAFTLGLGSCDLAFYTAIANELVDREMSLRRRLTGRLPDDRDARVTTELTRGARTLRNYVIDRVFQHRVAAAKTLKDEEAL